MRIAALVLLAVSCAQPAGVPPGVAERIAKLHSNDAVERGTAAYGLKIIGARALPAAPDLIALLSDDTQLVREPQGAHTSVSAEANGALTAIGDENIDPALFIAALKRLGWNGRDDVAEHLKYSGDPRTIPALVDALLEPGQDLPEIGIPDFSPAAMAERSFAPPSNPVDFARSAIANAMEMATRRVLERGGTVPAAPVKRLVDALQTPDRAIRKHALVALHGVGDPSAVDPLLAIARNPSADRELRVIATFSLSGIRDARVVPLLIATTNDADADVRGAAIRGLRDRKDRRAIPALTAALRDPRNRGDAVAALASIGDESALPPLLALLESSEGNTRQAIAQALGDLRDERAVDPLIAALEREKLDWVRDAIKRALEQITHQNRGTDAASWKTWRARTWWEFWK